MAGIQLDVLGPPVLRLDGEHVAVESRKVLAVLAYVHVEGPQTRDALDALLWPESDATRARAALRRTLSAIRRALPREVLAEGDDVGLGLPLITDLDRVEEILALDAPSDDLLAEADALHRGPFLDGLHFRDAEDFAHWRRDVGTHLDRRRGRLLDRWVTAATRRGDLDRAMEVARRRLALDPLHEPTHQLIMQLHGWTGDRSGASRQYAECLRLLDQQLGVAPLPTTSALEQAIRSGSAPPPPTVPPPTGLPTMAGPEGPASPARTGDVPPLVGRDEELRVLLELHRGGAGDGVVAIVTGEPGIGRTRLLDEVAARVDGPVVRLPVMQGEATLAYAAVTTALRRLGPRVGRLDHHVQRELARLVPDVVDVAAPTDPLSTPGARTLLVDACATAIAEALADGDGRGLLLADDLDHADEESLQVLAYLCNRLQGTGTMVLASAQEPLGLPAVGRSLRLGRLGAAEVAALADHAGVGGDAERLAEESEGVPFLVLAYAEAARAGGTDWDLPQDVRAVISARLNRIDEIARQVLTATAVLGGAPDGGLVQRVSGRSDEEFVEAMEALSAAGLVREDPGGGHAIIHGKVREVVLAEASPSRRRLLHSRAADTLADQRRLPEAAVLAHHLGAAGREDEAGRAHAAAGRRAAGLFADELAVGHLEEALAMDAPDQAAILVLLGDVLMRTGAYGKAADRFTRARAHGAHVAIVEERLGALALRRGQHDQACAHLERALEVPAPSTELAVAARCAMARALLLRGEVDEADRHAAAAVDLAASADVASTLGTQALNVAGMVARRGGDVGAALAHLRASLAIAPDAESRAAALNNLALVLGEAGQHDEALEMAHQALEAGRLTGDRHREAALLNNLADSLHAVGRTAEAMELQAAAAERFAGVGEAMDEHPGIWALVDW